MVQNKFRGVGLCQKTSLAVALGLCLGLFSYVSLTQAEVVGDGTEDVSMVYLWQQEEISTTTVRIDRPFLQLVDLSGLSTTVSATLAFDFDSRELDGASGTTTPADYAEIGVIINGERIVLSEIAGLPGNHIDEQSSFEKELPQTLTNADEVTIFAEVFANATTSDRVLLTNTRMFVSGVVEDDSDTNEEENNGNEEGENTDNEENNEDGEQEENGDGDNEADENTDEEENVEDNETEVGEDDDNEGENTDDNDENTNDESNIDEGEGGNTGEETEQAEVELFATSSRTVTPSKPLSEVIDLSALSGKKVITLAFDFDTSELDASPKDLIEIGLIINGEKEVLQVIEGLASTNNTLEYGSTSTTSAKLVSSTDALELYATVLANTESDKAVLTNIVLTAKAQSSTDDETSEEDEEDVNDGDESEEGEGSENEDNNENNEEENGGEENENEDEEGNGNENEVVEDDNENNETEDEEDDNVEEDNNDEENNNGEQSSYVIKIGVNPRTSAAYQASIMAPRLGSSNAFSETELRDLYKARF